MRRLLPALLLAVACGADPAPVAAPTTPPVASAPSGTTPPPATPAVVVSTEKDFAHFSSPSKNIGCGMSATGLSCDIAEKDWQPPPGPASCGGVGDYVGNPTLTGAGKVEFHCQSDTVLGATRVLPYGHAVQTGDLRCTSERRGMTCVHLPSGHGFTVSRARLRTF